MECKEVWSEARPIQHYQQSLTATATTTITMLTTRKTLNIYQHTLCLVTILPKTLAT